MKNWKLISGIIGCVLFLIVTFQSCAAGFVNSVEGNGEVGGSVGFLVALILLSGGIVSIATRKGGKGGNIACLILFGLGALVGFCLAGGYADLYIWSGYCLICAIMSVVGLVKKTKETA